MSDDEKDMSYPYSRQEDGYAITLVGGDSVTKPVYCIDCQLPHTHRPKDEPLEMNMSQALEHVQQCHHEVNQGMNQRGYERLISNEKRYRNWRVQRYLE